MQPRSHPARAALLAAMAVAVVVIPIQALGQRAPAETTPSSRAGADPTGAIASQSGRAEVATGAPNPVPSVTSSAPATTARPSAAATTAGPGAAEGVDTAASATPGTSAIVPGTVNRSSLNLRATYDVSANLAYGTRRLSVTTTIVVENSSGSAIDRLELNTIAARLGGLVVRSASVDGRSVTASRSDQTLIVPLGGVLPAGASTTVRIAYGATLRSDLAGSNWMFTRTNGVVDLYRWIPWISRSTPFSRPNHGDPFVTPVSPNVRVRITTDRPLVIASTGRRVASSGLTQTFVAENVRDFAVSASPYYRVSTTTVGSTQVRVYTLPGGPASTLRASAARALSRMSALVGPYPYTTYTVAQTAGGYGMEAPMMIWIPRGASNLAYLVSHETAHQWFYGLVGNDQARQPFTDEAAADFLARYTLSMKRASRCSTARLDLTIYQYSSGCYYEVVYIQGGNFIDSLRRAMGSTLFWRTMRAYVAQHRYQLASEKVLLDQLDAATPLNFVPRYEPRFPRSY